MKQLIKCFIFFVLSLIGVGVFLFKNKSVVVHGNKPIVFILCDFDGVIADSFDTIFVLCNELSREYGFSPITPEELLQLRHISIREIITKHLKIPWYRISSFHKKLVSMVQQRILEVPVVPGIREALKQLKNQGYKLGILSSNGEQNIRKFLQHNDLDIFDVVYADSSLFGKHHVINRFLRKFDFHTTEVVYIGDEVRDIEAAKKSGVRIVAVSWGFNSAEVLLSYQPDKMISHCADLIPAIQAFNRP